MLKRYLTGLDWSGDPGDPRKSAKLNQHFVAATCTVNLLDHDMLDRCLATLREQMGFSSGHVFRHADSSDHDRRMFFEALASAHIAVHCICIDKTGWSPEFLSLTSGPERIRQAIIELVPFLNEEYVAGQKLLVDMRRDEKAFVEKIRRDLRSSLRTLGRPTFDKIVARPDHRADAAAIQVADMFAGEVRATSGEFVWGDSTKLSVHSPS